MPLPTLVFAALATLAVTGCGVNLSVGDDTTHRTEEGTIPVGGLEVLDITTENGAVDRRPVSDEPHRPVTGHGKIAACSISSCGWSSRSRR
jgi:hypothetical protein